MPPRKKQKTQPKKGDPIEIPVPKRREIDDVLKRAARGSDKPQK
jgi:hypothetical protein